VIAARSGGSDLLLGGFMRSTGPFVPLDLARERDDDGEPLGYRLLTGVDRLSDDHKGVWASLPERFRFKEVVAAMGGRSDSNAANFLKTSKVLGIVKKEGRDYVKVVPAMECVEQVEQPSTVTPSTPATPPGTAQTIH
jgi:hypothetical protein